MLYKAVLNVDVVNKIQIQLSFVIKSGLLSLFPNVLGKGRLQGGRWLWSESSTVDEYSTAYRRRWEPRAPNSRREFHERRC